MTKQLRRLIRPAGFRVAGMQMNHRRARIGRGDRLQGDLRGVIGKYGDMLGV